MERFGKGRSKCHRCLYELRKARELRKGVEYLSKRREQQRAAGVRYWRKSKGHRKRNRQRERRGLKYWIRKCVQVAIREGYLERPKVCSLDNEKCSGQIEAHHLDYNRPLYVQWLCRAHHMAWHRLFLAEEIELDGDRDSDCKQ